MSMWYEVDVVLILKEIVCPAVALIDVANPWIEGSPAPFTSQSLGESPGKLFSHATALTTGGPQGPAAAAAGGPNSGKVNAAPSDAAKVAARRHRCCETDASGLMPIFTDDLTVERARNLCAVSPIRVSSPQC